MLDGRPVDWFVTWFEMIIRTPTNRSSATILFMERPIMARM